MHCKKNVKLNRVSHHASAHLSSPSQFHRKNIKTEPLCRSFIKSHPIKTVYRYENHAERSRRMAQIITIMNALIKIRFVTAERH